MKLEDGATRIAYSSWQPFRLFINDIPHLASCRDVDDDDDVGLAVAASMENSNYFVCFALVCVISPLARVRVSAFLFSKGHFLVEPRTSSLL